MNDTLEQLEQYLKEQECLAEAFSDSMDSTFGLKGANDTLDDDLVRKSEIEKILHYLQTDYGKNPCKGFGG